MPRIKSDNFHCVCVCVCVCVGFIRFQFRYRIELLTIKHCCFAVSKYMYELLKNFVFCHSSSICTIVNGFRNCIVFSATYLYLFCCSSRFSSGNFCTTNEEYKIKRINNYVCTYTFFLANEILRL